MTERARAALYVRVSRAAQTTENQERELGQWAARLGFDVVRIFAGTASGGRGDRAALTELLAAAHRREFDTLLFWALDRLTREGIAATFGHLDQLRATGVRVLSLQEPWLDTASPVWEVLVAFTAWWARQERQRLVERIRAGQARARARGVRLGRHPRVIDLPEVQRRLEKGQSWRHIARA